MGRKKKRVLNNTNNVQEVNLAIDYAKLASAIIEAQKSVQKKTNNRYRTRLMKFFNGMTYVGLLVICMFVIMYIWFYEQVGSIIERIFFTIFVSVLAIYCLLSQQESFQDSEEAAIQYFGVNISFIALIFSIIALLLEVVR